jgi:hypothetical protein
MATGCAAGKKPDHNTSSDEHPDEPGFQHLAIAL